MVNRRFRGSLHFSTQTAHFEVFAERRESEYLLFVTTILDKQPTNKSVDQSTLNQSIDYSFQSTINQSMQ
jgi:hypothetical protein